MKGRRAGRSRVSQVLKAGRGRKKRRRRRGEKEGKKGEKERRIGKHVVGREILRKLGTRLNRSDGGRVFLARFIDSVSARTNYGRFALPPVLSNGVPKLAAPLRSTRQSLSSEKKEKKKRKATRKFSFFSLTLSLFFVYHHQSLFRPLLSFPYLSRDRARFRPRRQPANYSI